MKKGHFPKSLKINRIKCMELAYTLGYIFACKNYLQLTDSTQYDVTLFCKIKFIK